MQTALKNEIEPMYDDQTDGNYPPNLSREELESVIKLERIELYNHSKSCGANALIKHLQGLGIRELPSERTIGRILQKQGLSDGGI
jgi:hypothetical protein